MTFKILTRTEMSNNYSGFSINEYIPDIDTDDEKIIDGFLTPDNFKHEDFHSAIRFSENTKDFLGHALNLDKVSHKDFKVLTKSELLEFFDKLWPKENILPLDKLDIHLVDKFCSIIKQTPTDKFYLIAREFFDLTIGENANMVDERLLFDITIYNPYCLIIWFDKKTLNVCEYLAD